MEKQPRVLGAFRQCELHLSLCFSQIACRSERPGQGIVTKDITTRTKFGSRKSKCCVRRHPSRREIHGQRPRIAARAMLVKVSFDLRRFGLLASYTQRLG